MLILYTFEQLDAGKAVYTPLFLAAAAGTVATQWLVKPLQERIGAARTITISFWLWTVALIGTAMTSTPAVAIWGVRSPFVIAAVVFVVISVFAPMLLRPVTQLETTA